MPDIVSLRYFPTDVPYRDPDDPGLAPPPEGRPYEIVARHPDGSATRKLVYPDLRRAARDPDATAVAQSFAGEREALYCRQARAWFVWDGALWRQDRGGTVALAIEALARAAVTNATRGVAPPIGVARLATSAELLARDILAAGEWDADPMLLGTPGGTVDLATGALRPAAAGDRITRATLVAPTHAACPRWETFLDEAMGGDAALIGFLRRFLGYALTGSTAEHALLFGHGDGGNGKTVFCNVVRAKFSKAHGASIAEDFHASPVFTAPSRGRSTLSVLLACCAHAVGRPIRRAS